MTVPDDQALGFFVPELGPLRGKRSADRDLDRALFADPLESDLFLLRNGIMKVSLSLTRQFSGTISYTL